MREKERLSILIMAANEEERIERAIKSALWADEVILIDGGSTDNTMEIARRHGLTVIENPWPGFAAQRAFAIKQAGHPWSFALDADEEITPELREEIESILANQKETKAGYYVPRLTQFCGRWIYHSGWYPDYVLRLFRTDRAEVKDLRIHESIMIHGSTGKLKNHMRHYSYPTLRSYLLRFNDYTSLGAEDAAEKGRAGVLKVIVNPLSCFFKMYILRRGFLDGLEGLVLAVLSATYVMSKYYKALEIKRGQNNE